MTFGLTGEPKTFSCLGNDLCREFLDEFDLEEDKKAVCGTTLVLTLAVQLQHVV